MALKLYIRHLQMYDKDGTAIVYVGGNPLTLSIQPGLVPQTAWLDVTNQTEGLNKLHLKWDGNEDSHIQTGISGELTLSGNAYKFVKHWLNDHVAAPLQAIEVRLEDVGCVTYTDFVIKSDGLRFCNSVTCEIDVVCKQKDDVFSCIQKTAIADNWQGWFHQETTKEHVRFRYCDEVTWWLLACLLLVIGMLGGLIFALIPIIFVVTLICYVIDAIPFVSINCPSLTAAPDLVLKMFEYAGGCNREHPAPFLRDYITNVCDKCGVTVNASTFPILFDPSSDYYNACYFSPEIVKGLSYDARGWWIEANEPLLTLDMLLDKLKVVYNAKWRLIGSVLYFNGKDDPIGSDGYLFDFVGADAGELISDICYEWNGDKKPAFMRGIYQKDGIDSIGNGGLVRENDIVDFNNPINPMLEGELSVISEFGGARFMWDGVDSNYISNAALPVTINLALTNITSLIYWNQARQRYKDYYGFVLMKSDMAFLPKILIWDGVSKRGARAVRSFSYDAALPSPNAFYNTDPYEIVYPNNPDNEFNQASGVYNYPMYFDAKFTGNLYDRFHQMNDPRRSPALNKTFDLMIKLCCGNLKRLRVDGNGSSVALGAKLRLFKDGFYTDGIIEEIEAVYELGKDGKYIKIKGKI